MTGRPSADAGVGGKDGAASTRANALGAATARAFAGPAGRLDARVHGDGPPVLLLHPHPQWGGSMGSRLVYDLAVALAAAGWMAVRFDFRGVGRSEGEYGHGTGEVADALHVAQRLREETGGDPALVGYSFGGGVACRVAALRPVARLVLVATPARFEGAALRPLDDAARAQALAGRAHVVVGDMDPLVPLADARALAAAFRPPATLSLLQGAAHFLEPSRNRDAVAAVLAALP